MAGTKEGAKKAARTNLEKHGADFYSRVGRKGGRNSCNGGFASNLEGMDGLTGRQRASIAGAKGGRISRRGPSHKNILVTSEDRPQVVVVNHDPAARAVKICTGIKQVVEA